MVDIGSSGLHLLRHVLACPRCGNDALEAVSDGEDTNFLCRSCWACWHWDMGYLIRVSPPSCPGCQHKTECLAHWADEAPGT